MFLKRTKLNQGNFKKVLKEGSSLKEKNLVLKYLENNLGKIRFGFLVSKKVSKKATIRNKIKRQLRELVRIYQQRLSNNYDLVFIALPGFEKNSFLEINEIFLNLLKRANIIKNDYN